MAAIRSVPPSGTYEEWFKILVKFITPPAETRTTSLEIIMDTYVEFSVKEVTRRKRGGEPRPRTVISALQQKMPQGDKWLSLLSNGENKTGLFHLFVNFLKIYENNVPIVINVGEYTWRIQDGVSPLHLFYCNNEEADSRIVLHASKSSGNVVIVANDTDILMLLIYSYSTCEISKEWVLKCDTNSYANIGTVCKYLGSTVSRNILEYHAITGWDTTSFFYIIGKTSPFKEVLKKSSWLGLIECLGKSKSLSNTDIENCMTFIQTVLYGRNINEACVETRINIYDNQRTKIPWHYFLISTLLLRLFFDLIISATSGFAALEKPYH